MRVRFVTAVAGSALCILALAAYLASGEKREPPGLRVEPAPARAGTAAGAPEYDSHLNITRSFSVPVAEEGDAAARSQNARYAPQLRRTARDIEAIPPRLRERVRTLPPESFQAIQAARKRAKQAPRDLPHARVPGIDPAQAGRVAPRDPALIPTVPGISVELDPGLLERLAAQGELDGAHR